MEKALPPIPAKRYFTIGEVSELCGVKPYVLRYWESEFAQLKPMKRRGNRRYYQHHEVLLIRRIRELLYDQGFTISGARNRLGDLAQEGRADRAGSRTRPAVRPPDGEPPPAPPADQTAPAQPAEPDAVEPPEAIAQPEVHEYTLQDLRDELLSIRALLSG